GCVVAQAAPEGGEPYASGDGGAGERSRQRRLGGHHAPPYSAGGEALHLVELPRRTGACRIAAAGSIISGPPAILRLLSPASRCGARHAGGTGRPTTCR